MKLNKSIFLTAIITIATSMPTIAYYRTVNISVGNTTAYVNGQPFQLDYPAYLSNTNNMVSSTTIPIIANISQNSVHVDEHTKVISVYYAGKLFQFMPNENYIKTTDLTTNIIELTLMPHDSRTEVVDGVVFVPLRGLVEILGFRISWEASTKTVTIY